MDGIGRSAEFSRPTEGSNALGLGDVISRAVAGASPQSFDQMLEQNQTSADDAPQGLATGDPGAADRTLAPLSPDLLAEGDAAPGLLTQAPDAGQIMAALRQFADTSAPQGDALAVAVDPAMAKALAKPAGHAISLDISTSQPGQGAQQGIDILAAAPDGQASDGQAPGGQAPGDRAAWAGDETAPAPDALVALPGMMPPDDPAAPPPGRGAGDFAGAVGQRSAGALPKVPPLAAQTDPDNADAADPMAPPPNAAQAGRQMLRPAAPNAELGLALDLAAKAAPSDPAQVRMAGQKVPGDGPIAPMTPGVDAKTGATSDAQTAAKINATADPRLAVVAGAKDPAVNAPAPDDLPLADGDAPAAAPTTKPAHAPRPQAQGPDAPANLANLAAPIRVAAGDARRAGPSIPGPAGDQTVAPTNTPSIGAASDPAQNPAPIVFKFKVWPDGTVDGPATGPQNPAQSAMTAPPPLEDAASDAPANQQAQSPKLDQPGPPPQNARPLGLGQDQVQTQILRQAVALNMRDAQWGQKLVAQIEKMHSDGVARYDISLRPKNLGDMHVNLEFRGDDTQVRIVTETASAARVLIGAEDRLGQMLEHAGFRLASFSTSMGGQGMGGQGHSQPSKQRGTDAAGQKSKPARHGQSTTDAQRAAQSGNAGGINVIA